MGPGLRGQFPRSLSTHLVRADTIPIGSRVWMNDDEGDRVWVQAQVLRQDNTILTVRRESTGEMREFDLGFGEVHPNNPKVVADMTALHHIHEAAILHNLAERSKLEDQRPYTFMGTILIAVNPLRAVPDPDMSEYVNRPINPEAPHPYAIAELAYHQLRLGAGRKAANQSIVVSGESGSGKTETAKIILRFLAHRSLGGVANLDQKVVDSSPILEAFGNAKTLRNDNSSRFGKFLKLQFTKDKHGLAGAFVETYLLEKSRVLTQGKGERNFHILYQLVAGASGVAADLKLRGVNEYKVLSESGCTTLDGVDDAEEFRAVKAALDTIGVGGEAQTQVWQVLASVLSMSNLEFGRADDEQGEIATIPDRESLSTLAGLLGVQEKSLEAMLTQKVTLARGETFIKQLGLDDANLTRDAIVKSLYDSLFLWIVSLINTSLGKGEDSLPFIGVLDIFGFENFETKNDFEQLLINFTNESLQDTFNKQVFNNELKLYADEGIEVVVSTCPDSTECIKMLAARPQGIIPSLDNVCGELNASDARFLEALHNTHGQHKHFPPTQAKDKRENFWVKHYAGKVKYTVRGWVERNMDRVPDSFGEILATSTHKVVRDATMNYGKAPFAAAPATAAATAGRTKPAQTRKTLVKPTVAKGFLGSQEDLNATLLSTTCNFARCIKPNAAMRCGAFENRYVVSQLQCLGILQTCEVLKVGMPTRIAYSDLKEVLGGKAAEAEKLFAGEPETALIAAILWAFEVPAEVFRLGRTRIFFRAGQISTLHKILNENGPEKGPWIFGRLQQALANRHMAKAAAEKAQAAISSAGGAVAKAELETTNAIGVGEDDDSGSPVSRRGPAFLPREALSGDDEYRLESAAKKARKAASNSTPQVAQFLRAAIDDEVGTFAVGALDRLVTASEEALKTINSASAIADELDAATLAAKGGDADREVRKLEDSFKGLQDDFREAKRLATAAEEAAAKCQVDKTQELLEQTRQKASAVSARAGKHAAAAGEVARAAKRQADALRRANGLLPDLEATIEKALGAVRSFKALVERVSAEEAAARDASDVKAKVEAGKRRAAAAAEKAAKQVAAETAAAEKAKLLEAEELASTAPASRSRGELMGRQPSRSVRDLLDTVNTPSTSVSPKRREKSDVDDIKNLSSVQQPPSVTRRLHADKLAFKSKFAKAVEHGCVEGHLMKQGRRTSRWKTGYFRLDDGVLARYDEQSLVGTTPEKVLKLTAHSVASNTNIKRCFCVRTEEASWFLAAQTLHDTIRWMTGINGQIHALFIKYYNVPEDDYWSQGQQGRFFYRMVQGSLPQFIRTYPELEAPRTGDGLFPGDVIEVVQVLTNNGKTFLRLADDRGWTQERNPADGSVLFEEAPGKLTPDKYRFPPHTKELVPILLGPGLESQHSGETLVPGQYVQAAERFTPTDGSGLGKVFVRLADGRGWIAVNESGSPEQAATAA